MTEDERLSKRVNVQVAYGRVVELSERLLEEGFTGDEVVVAFGCHLGGLLPRCCPPRELQAAREAAQHAVLFHSFANAFAEGTA